MKNISVYISEALVKSHPIGSLNPNANIKYYPQTKKELIDNIHTELKAGNENLNCIDTSAITDMSNLFSAVNYSLLNYDNYPNLDISEWNVSNVKNMQGMFFDYTLFNCDLSNWDVSNVTNMDGMFYACNSFNCDLSKWDVSNVEDMTGMFYACLKFKGDGLKYWNASNVTNMQYMFKLDTQFNCDISNWNVKNVTSMYDMFNGCKNFNCDISKWYLNDKLSKRDMLLDTPLESNYGKTPQIRKNHFIKKV